MWTDDRREELIELSALLRDASSLNTANCVIERMQRLVATADKLTRSDFRSSRRSFIAFLEAEALKPGIQENGNG